MKIFLFFICALLNTALYADNNTGNNSDDLTPPFGIRHFNAGQAPNFSLQDIDGDKFQLHDTRGRWVFLHFWASWCGPCRKEMPEIQYLAEIMPAEKFQIVMVNTAEDEDVIFEFMATLGIELNSLMDIDGEVTEVWKPRGLPTTFLINPKGEIKYQAVGGRDWNKKEYIRFLETLMQAQ